MCPVLSSGDDIRIYGQKLEGGGSSIRNIYAHHIYDIHTHTHTHTHTIYTHTHTLYTHTPTHTHTHNLS